MKKLLFLFSLLMLCVVGASAQDSEQIFSADVVASAKVAFSPGTTEITNSHATLSGGKMFAINEQGEDKELIGKKGSTFMFCMTNNNTYFKIELEKAIAVGDVFSAETYSRTDTNLGLFISTSATRPNECSTKLSIAQVTTEAYEPLSSYTVQEGDGLAGATELYIYRETGKSTYFNEFKITREATTPIPTNYLVDFNTEIATSSHDFKVASNWKHIVHRFNDGYSDYWMTYRYATGTGIDESGALYAGQQRAGDNYDYETTYDLLVTPVVSGEITIYAKKDSYGTPFVEFWSLNETATAKKEKLHEATTFENDTWTAVTYTVDTPQRIGIRAQYVYLDNFSAASAVIEPEKSILIASAQPSATTGTIYWDQQASGNVLVKYTVTVTNNGEVDLTQGTENYSVSVFNRKNNEVLFTVPVPQDLAIGATSEPFEVSGEVPTTIWPNSYTYINMDLMENLQGSIIQRAQSGYKAYEPKFVFRVAESTSTSSLSGTQAYGLVSEATTKSFEIRNDGAAPLTIKSITLPEGFTSDNMPVIPAEGLVIEKYTSQALNITLPVDVQGSFAGNLVIVYLDKNATEQTYTLAFSGNVLAAGTWAADFNNNTSTAIFPEGSIAENGIRTDYSYNSGIYDYYLYSYTSSSYASENNKFITPKLHANANDKLTFDVRRHESSSATYNLKVYVSTDRVNWGDPVYSTTAADLTSSYQTQEISFSEAGDYYVAFAIYGVRVDNIIGLQKVDVAHDLYIKSVSWPDASVKSGTSLSKPTIEIIPLTNEAAEAYTVKYVCGETVLAEGTPVKLTASANSSTSFTFNWTPSVESTTVYEGTKIVFDFGEGVTFETEGFDLTVTNEPKFHFVKTIPSSKWYEPTDYTTPIAFGKTNTADVKRFYVYNWGSAALTVKSIVAPEGFTVTPAEFTVAAFDESDMSVAAQAIDITFSTETAGTYSGDMVITYVDATGADATFTTTISGTKLDPTLFYANFDDGGWPAGSVYQKNISSSNGGTYSVPNYYITSSSTTENIFVTPKLSAQAGDKIQFVAKLYSSSWSEGKVVVYAAATREEVLNAEEGTTRVQLFSVSGTDDENPLTTNYQTFEVTIPEAGEYFLGFEISNRPYVDEIYGLSPVAVAHDMLIVSSNIPAEAMQNKPSTATINILNVGLQDETNYDIVLHIGDEVKTITGTETIAMKHKMSESQAISVPVQSPKAGTFPVYIEVKADDFAVATETVEVNFAEEVAQNDIAMQTGAASNTNLLHMNWNNSETVNLYSKALLANLGLTEGCKISSITFKGYNTGAKDYSSTLNVWYEFTDDETQAAPGNGKYDTSAMTNILSTTRSWANAEGSRDDFVDLITINFETPIVYTGKSLRIVVSSEAENYQNGTYFVQSTQTGSGTSYYNRDDTKSNFESTQSWSSNSYLPAIYIGLATEPVTFTGIVKDELTDNGIEGVLVTLISKDGDNIQYAGTTDADGKFNINVIQNNREYSLIVTKDEYASYTEENVDLTTEATIVICDVTTGIHVVAGKHMNNGEIYDLRGQKVTGTLKKGVYIINGKKTVVK